MTQLPLIFYLTLHVISHITHWLRRSTVALCRAFHSLSLFRLPYSFYVAFQVIWLWFALCAPFLGVQLFFGRMVSHMIGIWRRICHAITSRCDPSPLPFRLRLGTSKIGHVLHKYLLNQWYYGHVDGTIRFSASNRSIFFLEWHSNCSLRHVVS